VPQLRGALQRDVLGRTARCLPQLRHPRLVLVEGATLIRTVPGSARKLRPFSRAGPSAFHREIGVHQRIAAEVAWAVGSGPSADLQTSANRLRGVGSAGISMPHMHFAAHHPLPLRNQRAATAAAYRSLAGLAAASDEVSTLPAAEANDEAEASRARRCSATPR
jgi:hypothetical protein